MGQQGQGGDRGAKTGSIRVEEKQEGDGQRGEELDKQVDVSLPQSTGMEWRWAAGAGGGGHGRSE